MIESFIFLFSLIQTRKVISWQYQCHASSQHAWYNKGWARLTGMAYQTITMSKGIFVMARVAHDAHELD